MVGETRLVESCEAMKEKIAILALIELLFAAQATHRTVPFNTISQATRVPLNTVNKPFALGLGTSLLSLFLFLTSELFSG